MREDVKVGEGNGSVVVNRRGNRVDERPKETFRQIAEGSPNLPVEG